MKALSTLAALVASVAVAQAPAVLRPPKNDVPPVIPVEQAQTFLGGIYSATVDGGSARLCITPDGQGWECMLTASDTAATYMPTSTANAALATMNARIDNVADGGVSQDQFDAGLSAMGARVSILEANSATHAQVDAGLSALAGRVSSLESTAATQAQLDAGLSAATARLLALETNSATRGDLDAGISAVTARVVAVESQAPNTSGALTALTGRVTTLEATSATRADVAAVQTTVTNMSTSLGTTQNNVTALTSRVATLEANAITSAQLASAVATLNARITTVETLAGAGKTLCNSVSVVGINIPILGISPPTNVNIPGAQANRPCFVAPASNLPLTAHPECSSTAGAAAIVFRAAGLLGALSIPTGTYAACVVNQ